jgi:hypothetical protein
LNATWDNECNVGDILKMSFQNRFVRGHLFVKMHFLAVGDLKTWNLDIYLFAGEGACSPRYEALSSHR